MKKQRARVKSVALCGMIALFSFRCGDDEPSREGASGEGGDAGAGGSAMEMSGMGGGGESGEGGNEHGTVPPMGGSGGSQDNPIEGRAGRGGRPVAGGMNTSSGMGGNTPVSNGGSAGSNESDVGGTGGREGGPEDGLGGSLEGGLGGSLESGLGGSLGGDGSGGSGAAGACAGLTPCDPAHGSGSGDSCSAPRLITQDTFIQGESFAADFGDQHDFTGPSCAPSSPSSPEAVFAIDVPANTTVLLREMGNENSVDATLMLRRSCSDSAECVATRDPELWAETLLGASYHAEEAETLFGVVETKGQPEAPYYISIEYPKHLGSFGVGATVPVVSGGALGDSAWKTYQIEVTEIGFLYGELTRTGDMGDLDIGTFDHDGFSGYSGVEGDESFAIGLSAGSFFVEVDAYSAVEGYSLNLFTDPMRLVLVPVGLDDAFVQEEPSPIPAGRSLFYLFQMSQDADATISVHANGGDPDLMIYLDSGERVLVSQNPGSTETFGARIPGASFFALRVLATPENGDIPSHELTIAASPLAPPP